MKFCNYCNNLLNGIIKKNFYRWNSEILTRLCYLYEDKFFILFYLESSCSEIQIDYINLNLITEVVSYIIFLLYYIFLCRIKEGILIFVTTISKDILFFKENLLKVWTWHNPTSTRILETFFNKWIIKPFQFSNFNFRIMFLEFLISLQLVKKLYRKVSDYMEMLFVRKKLNFYL